MTQYNMLYGRESGGFIMQLSGNQNVKSRLWQIATGALIVVIGTQ